MMHYSYSTVLGEAKKVTPFRHFDHAQRRHNPALTNLHEEESKIVNPSRLAQSRPNELVKHVKMI